MTGLDGTGPSGEAHITGGGSRFSKMNLHLLRSSALCEDP
jgi:hypothetical protein